MLIRLFSVVWGLLFAAAVAADDRPNIVVILADDMGYSDIAPFGGEIDTPTLSRLAKDGLRFTQFYNTARCCPTRASLLTGLYPHQAGIGWMTTDLGSPGYRGDLSRECVTIGEVLRSAGYSTCVAGKWHVTPQAQPAGPKGNWPLQRGFDRFYGTLHGSGSFFDPSSLTRDNEAISPFADSGYQPQTYYYTDAISDHAARFIHDQFHPPRGNAIRPLFLYVAYTAAHWPMHALPDDIAKYQGKYERGYDSIRQARYERLRNLGLISADCELSPPAEQWESAQHKAWQCRCMEVYAAMVDRMDQGIGRIVKALEDHQQLDNTLILYLQDNGGCAEDLSWFPLKPASERPAAPTLPRIDPAVLQTAQHPEQTRDGYPVRMGSTAWPGPADTYVAYGKGWANVSNTPFREYKHWVHEGGISTPLIAHWPRQISRKGELEHQPGHLIDIMATCVDIARAEYPKRFHEHSITPLEGTTLVPAFAGKALGRDALYFEHEGNRAIRAGKWKLVALENQPWELYDMERDRSELHDLAELRPELVSQLATKWDAWAKRADVLPLGAWNAYQGPNRGYKESAGRKPAPSPKGN